MGAPAGNPPGQDHHIFSLVERRRSRDERAAALGRLHDQHRVGQAGDQPIAAGKEAGVGWGRRRRLGDHRAGNRDPTDQVRVLGGVDASQARAEHGDGAAPGLECGRVRRSIDTSGQTTDDHDPGARETIGHAAGQLESVARCGARSNQRDRWHVRTGQRRGLAADPEAGGWVGNEMKARRKRGLTARDVNIAHVRQSPASARDLRPVSLHA